MNNFDKPTTSRPTDHRGFTLIELLLVISIIAVLSTMALGVMRKAQDDAREAATRARIVQIEAILAVVMEDYEVRRLPISNRELAAYVYDNSNHMEGSQATKVFTQTKHLRRRILMDIISAEMPRPFVEPNTNPPVFKRNPDLGRFPTNVPGIGTGSLGFSDWLDAAYPGLAKRLSDLVPAKVLSFRRLDDPEFNLPGEYLYAILERIDVDGTPATESLGNSAIGNSDDDRFPEIVDAWGEPMQLRIWQIIAEEVEPDVWQDFENPNFDARLNGVPLGYKVLDPTEPRDITKIRTEVASTRLFN